MSSGRKLVVHNGLLLVPGHAGITATRGWLAVDHAGIISEMGPGKHGAPPAETEIDAEGCYVAPGFVSAHSHLHTSGLRGIATDQSLYGWGRELSGYTLPLDADDIYWLTLHGAIDFLNNGITTAYDFARGRTDGITGPDGITRYSDELRPQDLVEGQLIAKMDAGIRFIHSVLLDAAVGTDEEVIGRLDRFVEFAEKASGRPTFLGIALSGAVQRAPGPEVAALEVRAMHRHHLLNQAHFLETAEHVELQRSKFSWYEEAGALGPNFIFGHFVQADRALIAKAARTGCGMSWQPMSNGRLASGIADIPAILAAGMRVGIGLDDQSCTDVSDPFENMRFGMYLQRAALRDPSAMAVGKMLELHTIGSARVLRIDQKVGSLEVGKFGDFLIVDPRDPDTGPLWDPVASYVLACGLRNLKQVYVGGDLVSRDGHPIQPQARVASEKVHAQYTRFMQAGANAVV